MLPTNVVSFVKKMVASEGGGGGDAGGAGLGGRTDTADSGTTLSKIRHTLTSGIHGTVTKLSPTRSAAPNAHPDGCSISSSSSSSSAGVVGAQTAAVSVEERSLLQKVWDKNERFDPSDPRIFKPPPITTPTAPSVGNIGGGGGGGGGLSPLTSPVGAGKQGDGAGGSVVSFSTRAQRSPGSSCRVCVKTLKDAEFFKVCSECGNKVCEDCASYSTQSSDGDQEKWNCSICRRRLSSRAKSEQPSSSEGATLTTSVPPIMAAPMPPPSPGAPTALSLFSGLAKMASNMTTTTQPQQAANASSFIGTSTLSSSLTVNTQPSTLGASSTLSTTQTSTTQLSTTSAASTQPSITQQQQQPCLTTTTAPSTGEAPPPTTNGYAPRKVSRSSIKQTSLDRTRSIERSRSRDESRDRRPSCVTAPLDTRRPRDRSRERAAVPRRRSDNDDDNLPTPSRSTSVRRGRMSDYMLRDGTDDYLNFGGISAAHSETDVSRSRKTSQAGLHSMRPLDTNVARTAAEDASLMRESESSGDELAANNWQQRGRRRSIIRQKSYEEEDGDGETFTNNAANSLSLWGGGEPPVRRHSTQDPSRRDDSLEARRTRDSLDVPHSRVHRHHSWDYDVTRDTLPITGIMSVSASGSRHSSESDLSSEAPSERGSTTALADDPQRRFSRASITRRVSYKTSRGGVKNSTDAPDPYDADDQGVIDSSPSPLSPEVPIPGGAPQGSPRRSGTSSLEEEQWLHPAEDEYRSTRRRSSAVSESGRVLPTPPASPRGTMYPATAPTPPSGGSRITQSLEVSPGRDGEDGLRRQSSVTEGETIRIVIHDVDIDHRKAGAQEKGRRRVKVMRDMSDAAHRTRGLGMRVVGGKVGSDGHLFAYVVWTVPAGPAEAAGVVQGDKVLEWNGVGLTDRSFEEVCSIMEEEVHPQDEAVHLLIEHSNDLRSLDYGDEHSALVTQKKGSLEGRTPSEGENDLAQSATSRRKLPRIPGDLMRDPVSGKLQVQLWYDQDKSHLIVTVVSAHDLRFRDSATCGPPEAFVCLRLYPFSDSKMYSTGVAEPSCKPLWNSSFIWENLAVDSLPCLTLELSVWDYISHTENGFLGESLIDLRHAYLDERPTWYRLQERRSRSANATPRGSIVSYDFSIPSVRRPSVRSGSDDGEDSRNSSLDSGLLHPDLAWRESRRGSSLSEQAENEVYQLSRSYPHSLPQSRRSSVAYQSSSPEFKAEDLEARLSVSMSPLERRRSHSFRSSTRHEFLTTGDEYPRQRRASHSAIISRSHSVKGSSDHWYKKGTPSNGRPEEDGRWSVSQDDATPDLGPGQVVPRGYRDILTDDFTLGEIHLALTLTKGQLEVEVRHARGLPSAASGQEPDTYVKTYLKDGDRRINKRKTRVTRHSREPEYNQTLRYAASDALGRSLLVMVWERQRGFEHNIGMGVAEVNLSKLEGGQKTLGGWYRLLPVSSVVRVDSDSGDSVR
ncbi:regulating synaptic membrane exocytosis protein 2-like isoform X2 [Eriocheir sinensis]|uniref:regulating synaptic membrane exocytosis protein 2-like isoform X2 n=1 Tax=Eriocheir sinensis TaxID=95602 RepID=UPI0021C59B94|nr:regulating synaptic membrane exocytosis protein 2-like isoform X2 [Eriocheir sinensis]